MMQKIIHVLYSLWPIVVIIGVIFGIISFFFSGEMLKKKIRQAPYIIIAVLLMLVMCLSGITGYFCTSVPNTINYTFDSALASLRSANLEGKLASGNIFDASKLIYEQSIRAGTVVMKNKTVELSYKSPAVVEESDDKVPVPKVIGMEQMEATSLLTESGLQFQVWWTDNGDFEYSDTYYIIDQSIPADSEVSVGTLVKLELSSVQP